MIRNGRYYAYIDCDGHWADGCTVRLESGPYTNSDGTHSYIVKLVRGGGRLWGIINKPSQHNFSFQRSSLKIPMNELRAFKVFKKLEESTRDQKR